VFGKKVVVNSRPVIEAFQESSRDQLDQIVVALEVFAKQHQVIVPALTGLPIIAVVCRVGGRFLAAVVPAPFGDIHFATDNRLYVALARFVEKIGCREQIAVICNRHGGHFLAGRFIEKLACFASAIEQAVIGMNVKVNELRASMNSDSNSLAKEMRPAFSRFQQAFVLCAITSSFSFAALPARPPSDVSRRPPQLSPAEQLPYRPELEEALPLPTIFPACSSLCLRFLRLRRLFNSGKLAQDLHALFRRFPSTSHLHREHLVYHGVKLGPRRHPDCSQFVHDRRNSLPQWPPLI